MGVIWRGFLDIIFGAMQFVYSFVGDWGLSIIVVTLLFRLLVWPLMVKQTRSMHAMRKIQPLMKEIQKKYADDKEKQSQEMMKLYQEHKVNPLAGCLPMLLQMPLFIGFFAVLMAPRVEDGIVIAPPLYGMGPLPEYLGYYEGAVYATLQTDTASFFNILPNIMHTSAFVWDNIGHTEALPYIIFLALSCVGILLPMLLMQKNMDEQQAKMQKMMTYPMVALMALMGWSFFPGGILLYMTVSSLTTAGQQFTIQRMVDKEEAAEEAALEEEKARKKAERKKGNKNKGN